ncbi:MAG: twin-arginine translocase TatA/TatE family subunit [Acidimicrobiia bacterium]
MNVGPAEILVVLVLAFLVVGPNKLPELARTLGRGMRDLRRLRALSQRQFDELTREPADPDPS